MIKTKIHDSKVIVIVAVITAISLLGDSMLYIALPLFWEEAGLHSIWQVGILLSINRLIRLPFNPIIGWVYQKITLKTGFIIAIILGSVTTLGYGLFNGFLAWLLLRGIWGIAWSFFRIGGLSVVAMNTDEQNRGKSIGMYNGIYRLGSLFGMLAGGVLVPIIGLDLVAIIFGLMTITGLPLILLFMKTKPLGSEEVAVNHSENSKFTNLPSLTNFRTIITGFSVTLLFQGVLVSTMSSVLEYHHGKSINVFGLALNVTLIAGVILSTRWVWEPFLGERFGHWSDGKKGRIPLLLISLTITSISFSMLSSNFPLIIYLFVTLIVLVGGTALTTIVDALALDESRKTNVVSYLTTYSIFQDLGASLGPFISFILLGLEYGVHIIYLGGAGILLLLAFIWLPTYIKNTRNFNHFKKFN